MTIPPTTPPPPGPSAVSREDAAAFRRLCRSSPWRWRTLRFDVEWFTASPTAGPTAPVKLQEDHTPLDALSAPADIEREEEVIPEAIPRIRAWLRRPDALRVEDESSELLFSTTSIHASRDAFYITGNRSSWLLPPRLVTPVYDDDGLIARRPEADYGDPVFGDARWSAMLDPVELAGSAPVPLEFPLSNVVEIHELNETRHAGRAALEAVVSPNVTYTPETDGFPLLEAGRTRLRIDLQTAVCVYTEALDGPVQGNGHDIRIHAVNEYMLDDLFVEHSMNLTDVRDHIPWIIRGPQASRGGV
ncbi:hypothetical protein ACTXOR_03555 [Arthrobacter rhombi]|uniref:hypothetical protein n=1 Tax=Arthrobacter rhombi TaxID=71253 RepID=UPI000B350FA9|nr:hypothetical protein [Arthrobacter rhombi]